MVGLSGATIPLVRLIIAQPHPGRLGMEGDEGTPLVYVGVLAFSIVGALIVSRHPRHPVGWIFCASGVSVALSGVSEAYAELGAAVPGSLPAVSLVNAISGVTFLLGFFLPTSVGLLLFPDGRLPSPRWRPAIYAGVGGLVLQFLGALTGGGTTIGDVLQSAGIAATVAAVLAAVASLVLRWEHAPTDVRQQLKWVGAAAAIVLIELVGEVFVITFRPALLDQAVLYFSLAYTCVPIAVGIAILRYGLYEIDLLINRAVVYVLLTALLAGVYSASTALFQRLFVGVTGQSSDGAIVVTVFILATIFTPARNRLQAAVDLRFKDARDLKRLMGALEREIEAVVGVMVGRRVAERLLHDATEGAAAVGGALYFDESTDDRPAVVRGSWDGHAELVVPLRAGSLEFGRLALGRRRTGAGYGERERDSLQRAADAVAQALSLGKLGGLEVAPEAASAITN
jgi:hypothetical protein